MQIRFNFHGKKLECRADTLIISQKWEDIDTRFGL